MNVEHEYKKKLRELIDRKNKHYDLNIDDVVGFIVDNSSAIVNIVEKYK